MPAYGGSLFDPTASRGSTPLDESSGLRLRVSRPGHASMCCESVQVVTAEGDRRRISFREVDVEQIGYVYEGLLGYTCAATPSTRLVLGLVGKDGEEPEIDARPPRDSSPTRSATPASFADALLDWH